jgi:hypothetical protein
MNKYFFLFLISLNLFASNENATSLSFGPVQIGEERLKLDFKDFDLIVETNTEEVKIKAAFISDSLQWARSMPELLMPRARIRVQTQANSERIHLRQEGQSITFQNKENLGQTEIFVSLFDPSPIDIYFDGKKVGTIIIRTKDMKEKTIEELHLVDYSCANFDLVVTGIDDQYLSLGCSVARVGKSGKEYPILQISWLSPNLQLLDKSAPPYITYLTAKDNSTKFLVIDQNGQKKEITITAKIPKRLYLLKTAAGLGPYTFAATQDDLSHAPKLSWSAMLYGNYYVNDKNSIRFFEAIVKENSTFNNLGFYFAYEGADGFDHRLSFVPLLGLQLVTFKYSPSSRVINKAIFPQGFELVYRHAFGLRNYNLVYGMFLSTSSLVDYENLWIRFGKRIFVELNYINWADSGSKATMTGLSIGFPFMNFF